MKKLLITTILLFSISQSFALDRHSDSLALVAIKEANPQSQISWDYSVPIIIPANPNKYWYRVLGNKDRITQIHLWGMEIKVIPDNISNLSELTTLNFNSLSDNSENKISTLPATIGELSNLTKLSLYGNSITALPEELLNLTNLRELNVEKNNLHFDDLVMAKDLPSDKEASYFFPQKKLGKRKRYYITDTSAVTLESQIRGDSNTTYEWYKNSITTPIGYSKQIVISETGAYYSKARHPSFPEDSLVEEYQFVGITNAARVSDSLVLVSINKQNPELTLQWNDTNHLEDWEGIKISDGRVIQLVTYPKSAKMTQNRNFNILPFEIGLLSNLELLALDSNNIGAIPSEIGQLKSLWGIGISNCSLNTLPEELYDLPKLEILCIPGNYLHFDDLIKSKNTVSNLDESKFFPQNILGSVDTFNINNATLESIIRGDSNTTYSWYLSDDMSTPVSTDKQFTATQEGDYICIAKNSAFPNDSLIQKPITVIANTSLNGNNFSIKKQYLHIGKLNMSIKFKANEIPKSISIIDMKGRTLVTKRIDENADILSDVHISSGVFILNLNTNMRRIKNKFIW